MPNGDPASVPNRDIPTQPPPDSSLPLPQAHALLTSFTTFLTVCIHNILFYRSIYPQATFISARAFNLPVHQNRHPKVCSWIRDAVDAVAAQLAGGNVDRVAVVIHSPLAASGGGVAGSPPPGSVLERWMFDVSRFPAWPGGAEAMFSRRYQQQQEGGDVDPAAPADSSVNWVDVDQQLRGALRRMAYAAENMDVLPDGCTFTVAVELKDEGRAPIGHPQAWIPSEPNLQTASTSRPESGPDIGGARTTAIRSVEAGPLFFECWVEEGKAKDDLRNN